MARLKATENMVDTANIFFVIIRQRFISFNSKRNYCFKLMCKFILKSYIHDTAIFIIPLKEKKIFLYWFINLLFRDCKQGQLAVLWLRPFTLSLSDWNVCVFQSHLESYHDHNFLGFLPGRFFHFVGVVKVCYKNLCFSL